MPRHLVGTCIAAFLLPLLLGASQPRSAQDFANLVAPLVDPAKLRTLGERGANPRVCKVTYWLETARRAGVQSALVVDGALASVGMKGDAATVTREALLRNLTIAERLGCLDPAGMADLRKGQSPTIRRGPYGGQELTVDHIVPRAVCPELDNVMANLEFMPARMNAGKGAKIGGRQRDLARRLRRAGFLSANGLATVEARARTPSPRNR